MKQRKGHNRSGQEVATRVVAPSAAGRLGFSSPPQLIKAGGDRDGTELSLSLCQRNGGKKANGGKKKAKRGKTKQRETSGGKKQPEKPQNGAGNGQEIPKKEEKIPALQGGEDTVGAMAFFLKPRPCTWDLAVDYNAAKQFQVDVTLDPTTAGPEVILSEDLKEATWGRPGRRWPQGPGRFDTDPCMLGSQGFTSGRHYWEVEASGRFWTVGVARESVRREGRILFKPNAEIWGLQKYDELCVALTAPSNTFVPLRSGEIGVYLDYEVGQVSFYALGTRCCVFTFRVASFSGERVFPYFCVLLSTIKLPPRA